MTPTPHARALEAFREWHKSPNRLPLEQPNSGDVATAFYAGWEARNRALAGEREELIETMCKAAHDIQKPSVPVHGGKSYFLEWEGMAKEVRTLERAKMKAALTASGLLGEDGNG